LQRELRRDGALVDDDELIETRMGELGDWVVEGYREPFRPFHWKGVGRPIAIKPIGRATTCSYSSRRLFFHGGRLVPIEFAYLWAVHHNDHELVAIFSCPLLSMIRWRAPTRRERDNLPGLVAHIEEVQARRLEVLPPESREFRSQQLSRLVDSGALDAIESTSPFESPIDERVVMDRIWRRLVPLALAARRGDTLAFPQGIEWMGSLAGAAALPELNMLIVCAGYLLRSRLAALFGRTPTEDDIRSVAEQAKPLVLELLRIDPDQIEQVLRGSLGLPNTSVEGSKYLFIAVAALAALLDDPRNDLEAMREPLAAWCDKHNLPKLIEAELAQTT
jgi:hypothetical protein